MGQGTELQVVYVEHERQESSPSFGSSVISQMVLCFPGCRKGWEWTEGEKQEKTGSRRWMRRKRRDFCQGKRGELMARVTGIMGVRVCLAH